ncbi:MULTISPECIES: acyl-CoA dehydrogenase family protein [unclassified Streptomyces]|uniref:acyl-CoA dehydrogenase family protein n=1 Tax=unclassified Streptomyces TaxID=2593676 RepID=UPI000AB8EDC5|nr:MULTISPECIES: acyl-CoA dehydrogenase family protein [unclassified Streptomyces]
MRRAGVALALAGLLIGVLSACGGRAGAWDGGDSVTLRVGATGWKREEAHLGVARAAQRYFHRFAHERSPANLGHPVAHTERFRRTAGEIALRLDSAEQLVFGGAERVDTADGTYTPEPASGARILSDRHAVEAVGLAVRLSSNPGLSRDNPLERHFRDVQCAPVHVPQEDVALLAVGSGALEGAG